jgi:metallo-beta-lactamase family protein
MRLQFLGATDTVTGSRTLVQHAGSSILVDCGLFQGFKQLRLRNWERTPFEPGAIDAVVLTHAHIDHSGYLPVLTKRGFRGRIFCSQATADLCRILLPDSARLQEEEADFANRHGLSKHRPALPLYTGEDAARCLKQLEPVPFERDFQPARGFGARFSSGGHMPGASMVRLQTDAASILFSGDLGRPHDLLLRPPARPPAADHVVVESTYGDREHDQADVLQQLADVVRRTAGRGGVVVIPAFAVGRAQALLHALATLRHEQRIPRLPVFLDSPMATKASEVVLRHPELLRLTSEERDRLARIATVVETPAESASLAGRHGPMVIVAGSGMATGGRVVHHLKVFAPDHRNTILLAGFQAGGTRGAALASGARTIRIHGQDVTVRAEVASLGQMSAHADAGEIIGWLRSAPRAPRTVFINHGEPAAADALRQRIERELGWSVHMPWYLDTVELGA